MKRLVTIHIWNMRNTAFSKYLYLGFVAFGLYLLLFKKEMSEAAIFFGIALAFDPFNQEISFNNRPTWQKLVLIIQVILVFSLFGISWFKDIKTS